MSLEYVYLYNLYELFVNSIYLFYTLFAKIMEIL